MVNQNEKTDFQIITDLVAVHALTQIAWQSSQEEKEEVSTMAEHLSDNLEFGELGEHHSDSSDQIDTVEINPVTFAWRLMKLLRRFFEGR